VGRTDLAKDARWTPLFIFYGVTILATS